MAAPPRGGMTGAPRAPAQRPRPRTLFAALLAGAAGAAAAGPASFRRLKPTYYDDVLNANCKLGSNCTDNGIPVNRGLCVQEADTGNSACWDVCNPIHSPWQYVVDSNDAQKKAGFIGLVAHVRAGLNSFVQCPGVQGDTCPPGDLCSADFLEASDIKEGRGLCVVDSSAPGSRACWDMCDRSRRPDDFTEGTKRGMKQIVEQARGGLVCWDGGLPWWAWVLIGVVVLACCACGCAACVASGLVKTKRSRSAPAQSRECELDYEQEEYRHQQQEQQQQPYDQQHHAYDQRHQQAYDQQAEQAYDQQYPPDALPPNEYGWSGGDPPPRSVPSAFREAPPPEPSPFPDEQVSSQQRYYDMSSGGGNFPGRGTSIGSMRGIPGLDEPNLFSSPQLPAVPTVSAQLVQPEYAGMTNPLLPGSNNMLVPGDSQLNVTPPALGVNTGSSYHTQLPFQSQSAPSSVQLRPMLNSGDAPVPFFTQLARR